MRPGDEDAMAKPVERDVPVPVWTRPSLALKEGLDVKFPMESFSVEWCPSPTRLS